MPNHTVGTREEWRAARLRLLEDEKALTRRSDELAAAASGPAVGRRPGLHLRRRGRPGDAARPLRGPLAAAGAALHVPPELGRRAARAARRSPTAGPGPGSTWRTMTWPWSPSPGRPSPSCWPTGAHGLGLPAGCPRRGAASTSTSACRSPSARRPRRRSTTSARTRSTRAGCTTAPRATSRSTTARAPGSAPSCSRTARSSTPTAPTAGAWTGSGACTSGSTGRRSGRNEQGMWWRRHDEYEPARVD